ncbi:MAG: DUF3619 family protein [Burkholderiales bacterium]
MNELEFAKKVAQQLNFGTNNLDHVATARLKAARERALAAYRVEQPVLATVGGLNSGERPGGYFSQHPRLAWGGLAVVLALAAALNFWQGEEQADKSPIDAEILASDLPLNAFTHQDFDAWLKNNSQ